MVSEYRFSTLILIHFLYIFGISPNPIVSTKMPVNNVVITGDSDDVDRIGGGSINEKPRLYHRGERDSVVMTERNDGFDGHKLSHLLHAITGLDRYPNYLSRWNNLDEIETLEDSLESTLKKVRLQKKTLSERKEDVMKSISEISSSNEYDSRLLDVLKKPSDWSSIRKILDPHAVKAILGSTSLTGSTPPTLQEVLSGEVDIDLDIHDLVPFMDEEMPDVYSFPLLTTEFCDRLINAVQTIIEFSERNDSCNNKLGSRPFDVDHAAPWLNDLLFNLILKPLARHLFSVTESFGDLDWRQGYIAGYSSSPSSTSGTTRNHLVAHTDDAEVTLNLCLGRTFEGGNLGFWGIRGSTNEGKFVGEYCPKVGYAIIHPGRYLHQVTEVTKGDRYVYIMWCRSWHGVRSEVCPCCWLTRRKTKDCGTSGTCICNPRWN